MGKKLGFGKVVKELGREVSFFFMGLGFVGFWEWMSAVESGGDDLCYRRREFHFWRC